MRLDPTLLRRLLSVGAVQTSRLGFRLKHHEKHPDAPLSPYKINLRVPSNKGALREVEVHGLALALFDLVAKKGLVFEGICGVPRAGEPFAQELRLLYRKRARPSRNVPVVTLRKEEDGSSRRIGGVAETLGLPKGSRVLLVDDLITRAESKLEAIAALEAAGYEVRDCAVIFDREEGGVEQMVARGYNTHAVMTVSELADFYYQDGLIDPSTYHNIIDHVSASAPA